MKMRTAGLVLSLGAVTCFVGGLVVGREKAALMPRELEVAPGALDLGVLSSGVTHRHSLKVSNSSSLPVTIENIKASCGCTSLSPSSVVIPAKESRDIAISVRPTPKQEETTAADFAFAVVITARARKITGKEESGAGLDCRWKLNGRVRNFLYASHRQIVFAPGSIVENQTSPKRTCSIRVSEEGASYRVRASSDIVQALLSTPADRTNEFTLTVEPRGGLRRGHHETTIEVAAIAPSGGETGVLSIPVSVAVVPDIAVEPGAVLLRPDTERTIIFRSRSKQRFKIDRFDVAPSDRFDPSCVALSHEFAPQQSATVTAESAFQGVHRATLTAFVVYENGAVDSIVVPLSGANVSKSVKQLLPESTPPEQTIDRA